MGARRVGVGCRVALGSVSADVLSGTVVSKPTSTVVREAPP
jgi:hypothetical protein